jgi:hypothetical protein
MSAAGPGWHPDPTGEHESRYWDGAAWTDAVADHGVAGDEPVGGAPGPTPPGPTSPGARRRPSPSFVCGVAAVAVALVTAVVVVVMGVRDDGETAADGRPGDLTFGPDGRLDTGDPSRDEIVDALTTQLETSGMADRAQAECFASVLVDEVGEERLLEILRGGGDVLFELSGEEQSAFMSAVSSCGIIALPTPPAAPDDD